MIGTIQNHQAMPLTSEEDFALAVSAPELLEALERLVQLTEHGWHGADRESLDGKYFVAGLNRARAAIAKAKGAK